MFQLCEVHRVLLNLFWLCSHNEIWILPSEAHKNIQEIMQPNDLAVQLLFFNELMLMQLWGREHNNAVHL